MTDKLPTHSVLGSLRERNHRGKPDCRSHSTTSTTLVTKIPSDIHGIVRVHKLANGKNKRSR